MKLQSDISIRAHLNVLEFLFAILKKIIKKVEAIWLEGKRKSVSVKICFTDALHVVLYKTINRYFIWSTSEFF